MQHVGSIGGLYIYPLKSCGVLELESAVVTKFGLAAAQNPDVIDRKWMVIDDKNVFMSQRTVPRMCFIKPSIRDGFLVLSAPGMDDLNVPIKPPANKVECKCKDSMVFSNVYGGDVAKWLTEFLQIPSDLACYSDEFVARRVIDMKNKTNQVNVKETDETIYSDYSQFMLMSDASMKDLNTRTPYPISFVNFRPNFIVKDCESYAEDHWNHIKIADTKFRRIRHCTRCLLTTVNPEKAEKDPEQEPLKTLRTYRVGYKDLYGPSPTLGINLALDYDKDGQVIHLNDKLYNVVE